MRIPFLLLLGLVVQGYSQGHVRSCLTDQVYFEELRSNPAFKLKRETIALQLKSVQSSYGLRSSTIKIPVVVHIVYHTEAQNLSDSQIYNQINILNTDFGQVFNTTYKQAAASSIQFVLASADPAGYRTTGITRTHTDKPGFPTGASIMIKEAGGKDPWPSNQYLNIWVGNVSGVLGFAYMPGSRNDGVVIGHRYFGAINMAPPFNLGRTVTHEVGHWLNLLHTWGLNTGCEADDEVSDTPNSAEPNYGCRPGHMSCSETDMVENYMDYSDDQCMNLFTQGQVDRMQALFAPGGYRASLLTSPGLKEGVIPPCQNGIKDGSELAIDCGGSCPPCDSALLISCGDGKKNGDESGIDCGGLCGPCPTCQDGVKNGTETGIDCGGSCSPCPCTSKGEFSMFDYIESIQINDSVSISGDNRGYSSFPNTFFTLYSNQTNRIKLTPGKISEQSEEYWSLWIDWNHNHQFESTELVYRNNAIGPFGDSLQLSKWMTSIPFPTSDTFALRIQMQWGAYGEGCANVQFGEIEDYRLILKHLPIDLCTNGILDSGEQGIDCGPGCTPCTVSYCSSAGAMSSYEFIQAVNLGSMNNVSGNNNGYIDFTPEVIPVKAGGQLNYLLQAGFGGNYVLYENWYVWADWNQDGDYTDVGELILDQGSTLSLSGTFNIPSHAEGKVHLRIQMKDNKSANPCELFGYGEVEDYVLDVSKDQLRKIDSPKTNFTVTTYPNPVSHTLYIQYQERRTKTLQLMLVNNLGTITANNKSFFDEHGLIKLDCQKIPEGIYYLVLSEGTRTETKRIVILH